MAQIRAWRGRYENTSEIGFRLESPQETATKEGHEDYDSNPRGGFRDASVEGIPTIGELIDSWLGQATS